MPDLIDDWMPTYDVSSRHKTLVRAQPQAVYDAIHTFDISRSRPVAVLVGLRGLPSRFRARRPPRSERATIASLLNSGFVQLAELPGEQLLLGLVGRFWTATPSTVRVTPEELAAFDRPGYAVATWAFTVRPTLGGNTNLRTETRVRCTDRRSRTLFRAYWTIIGPFSGLIRHEALRLIKAAAETPAGPGGPGSA